MKKIKKRTKKGETKRKSKNKRVKQKKKEKKREMNSFICIVSLSSHFRPMLVKWVNEDFKNTCPILINLCTVSMLKTHLLN